jgi:hypothetical protein
MTVAALASWPPPQLPESCWERLAAVEDRT